MYLICSITSLVNVPIQNIKTNVLYKFYVNWKIYECKEFMGCLLVITELLANFQRMWSLRSTLSLSVFCSPFHSPWWLSWSQPVVAIKRSSLWHFSVSSALSRWRQLNIGLKVQSIWTLTQCKSVTNDLPGTDESKRQKCGNIG